MSASALRSHFTFGSTAEHVLVLLVATTIAIVWYITSPIIITYDTLTYIDIASSIESGSPKAGALYWRLPAYPLILRAFGVIDFNSSVQGLVRFQLLLGVLMSWLFYVSLRLIDRRWAFWIAMSFILLCLPFLNAMSVMTEQIFMFGVIVLLLGCICYLTASRWSTASLAAVVVGLAAGALALTRPQGAYLPVVILPVLAALSWRRPWPLIAGVMATLALFAWGAAIMAKANPASDLDANRLHNGGITAADRSRTTGKMLFFSVYFASFHAGQMKVKPENGPATRAIRQNVIAEFTERESSIHLLPETRKRYSGSPLSLADDVFANPTPEYYFMMFDTLDSRLGLVAADRLMLHSAFEAIRADPMEALRFFSFRVYQVYFRPLERAMPKHPPFPENVFGPRLAAELAAAGRSDTLSAMEYRLDSLLRIFMSVTTIVVIATTIFAIRSEFWKVWLALMAVALYLNAVVVLGGHPLFRYVYYVIPLHIACALIGVREPIAAVKRKLHSSHWRSTAARN